MIKVPAELWLAGTLPLIDGRLLALSSHGLNTLHVGRGRMRALDSTSSFFIVFYFFITNM